MKILKYKTSEFSTEQIDSMKKCCQKETANPSRESIIANYFIKKELATFYKCPIEDIMLEYNPRGKPYFRNDMKFNITHSKNLIFIAISEHEIGIDVECMRPLNLKLINKIATQQERELLEKSEDINTDLIELWTVKEAYFKLIGTGISKPHMISCQQIKEKVIIETEKNAEYILTTARFYD